MTTTIENKICDLGPFDVLCGRDKRSYNNIANRRFRIMININLPKYLKYKTRTDRSKMIHALTHELEHACAPYRFLKQIKGGGKNIGCSTLVVLDHKQSREKIAHALRDAASLRKSMKRKQILESALSKQLTKITSQMLAEYKNSNGKRNNDHQVYYDLPRLSMLVFQDKAADVEELSQTPELRLSEMFDWDYR